MCLLICLLECFYFIFFRRQKVSHLNQATLDETKLYWDPMQYKVVFTLMLVSGQISSSWDKDHIH